MDGCVENRNASNSGMTMAYFLWKAYLLLSAEDYCYKVVTCPKKHYQCQDLEDNLPEEKINDV